MSMGCFRWLWDVLEGYGVFQGTMRCFRWLLGGIRVAFLGCFRWLWGVLDGFCVAVVCF